jgi:Carboxypeptidase regulatory-like domain/TonB-dependent Receptor Plug Domain/TonB dependent receptor
MKVLRGLLCVWAVIAAGPLRAQFEYGEILGTVRDASGAVVSGAKVTLTGLSTNVQTSALTNEQGNFSFPDIRGGNYSVQASFKGFRIAKSDTLLLRVGDRLRMDLTLQPGDNAETVNVEGEVAPLLETDTSTRGQVIQGQQIEELPLNKRDYTQLVLLVPGTTYNPDQRLGGAISVNGNRTLQNDYLLDGVDNNSHATSFRGDRVDVILPSVDAVQEFRVQSNGYSAEYGHSAGAVVNVTIKNGTNQFHGTGWEFFRNDDMDAHGWTPTLGGVKPKVRFNLYGVNIGGPIVKDKTFFFVNYEGDRERDGIIFQETAPILQLQQGNFSNLPSGLGTTLKVAPVDPTTGAPFPGGIIPQNRWSPVAARVLAYPQFPVPNAFPLIATPGAYISDVTDTVRSDKFDIRLDHYLSSNWRLFGRYSFADSTTFRPAPYPGYAEGSNNDQFGTTPTRGQSAVVGNTLTLTPTTILDLRLGYTRMAGNVFPPNYGSPSSTQLLGIPNLPQGPKINAGWPEFAISGLSQFGSTTSQPQYQIPNTYLASGVFSLQRGAHSIRAGSDITYIQTAVLDVSAIRGVFSFANTWTGNPFGDFLLGLPAAYTQTGFFVAYLRNQIYNFFVQDDYHVLPNLTLNLGLRYEYGTPIYEKYNRMSNYSLATGSMIQASDSDKYLVKPDRLNFAPRIGLAWTVLPRVVIRSAYGIFYQHTFRQGRENLLAENEPFLQNLTASQGPGSANVITLDSGPPANFFSEAVQTSVSVRGNDPNLKAGYVQQWNYTVQYSLGKDWIFEVGYVGNKGTHLSRFWNANQPDVAGPSATLGARRPNQGFGDVEYMDSGGNSFYNSLQTRLEKRFSNGLTLLHSFTYARGLDNVGAWNDPNGSLYPQDAYNFANEKALAENIIKFNSVASWVYELPFGRGRKMMASSPALVDAVLGNWHLDGIWTWRTGLPFTIASPACANCQMGGDRSIRANVVPGVSPSLSNPGPADWFNPAAFALQTTPYGTVGRDTVWGPGLQQWDLGAAKRFAINEQRYFQFRGEMFNTFNQVNFEPPVSTVGSAGFGTITAARPGRNVQLGLKFYW